MEDNIYFNDIKNGGWSQDSIRAFELIITSVLCKIFFDTPINSHHILSIIIILISGILLFIGDSVESKLISFFFTILNFLIFSIEILIEFKILHYISPYELNTLKGIIGIFITIIISFFYTEEKFVLYTLFENINQVLLIPFIISSAFYNLFIELIIKELSPTHTAISESISSIFIFIFLNFSFNLFNITGYIFILIASLIFNEFIILNFFNLDKYTRHTISIRGNEDYQFNLILIG